MANPAYDPHNLDALRDAIEGATPLLHFDANQVTREEAHAKEEELLQRLRAEREQTMNGLT